jgi:hypothetical protein
MAQDKNLPVDMIIVENTAIEGEHVEAGTLIKKMDAQLALDLAGSGKARPATPELIAEYKERAKQKADAEKAKAAAEAEAAAKAGDPKAFADAIAAAIAKGVAEAVAALQQPAAPAERAQ